MTKVEWRHGSDAELNRINKALENISEGRKLVLMMKLIKLYFSRKEEAIKVFGSINREDVFMLTWARRGMQLRGWYGLPGTIGPLHVDSSGRNLLFEVVADDVEQIERHIEQIIPLLRLNSEGIYLPNDVVLFTKWKRS